MKSDTFKEEQAVISAGQAYLKNREKDEATQAYEELFKKYKKLLKITRRLVNISDRNAVRLKEAKDSLERELVLIEENARLRDDVERITRHDLKGPLSAIINYPQYVKRDGELSEKQQAHLKRIESSGRKMLEMINLSLGLYKMEQGTYDLEMIGVDVAGIVMEAVEESETRICDKSVTVKIVVDGEAEAETSFVEGGDPLLLYSMVSNLFKNAIEASPKGETVTIYLDKNDRTTIRIHNQGVIPGEIRETFFEKYATAGKSGGTGLGTYSARLIAETHGGDIGFESSEEAGTTIQVALPRKTDQLHTQDEPTSETPDNAPAAPIAPGKKAKVLIVDDAAENIHVLMEALKDEFLIVAATRGEKALQLAAKEPKPDLVLLDVMMPEMDGYEVIKRLKKDPATAGIKVIFLTGMSDDAEKKKGLNLGAVDYQTKPFEPGQVKAKAKQHLF